MVKRPMRGDGSIYPRKRVGPGGKTYLRYVAQLSFGPRGNRTYLRRTRRTRAEARAALDELRDLAAGTSPSQQPLGSYLRSWLDETARPSVAPNTLRGYEDVIAHLEPIARLPLADLTAEDIEYVLNRMTAQRKHQKAATDASPKTRRNALLMLRAALGQAERRGHITRNPAKLVPLPRVPRRSVEAMTPEMAKAILAAVEGDRYEAAYALALTGLRASEILGLAWVDVGEAEVHVRLQLVGSGPTAQRAQPKTPASVRRVPLPGFVVELLAKHRQAQREERIAAGMPAPEGLVFVTPKGYAVNGSWLNNHFGALLIAAGLPRRPLHSLRHGYASLLAGLGVHPSVAQALLGHASSRTTLDVYTSVTVGQQRQAAELVGDALAGRVTGRVTGPRTGGHTG